LQPVHEVVESFVEFMAAEAVEALLKLRPSLPGEVFPAEVAQQLDLRDDVLGVRVHCLVQMPSPIFNHRFVSIKDVLDEANRLFVEKRSD
jgi:hypothetical protein